MPESKRRQTELNMSQIKDKQCRCMAKRHNFFTSCVSCGFIVCEDDEDSKASMNCPFCSTALLLPMTAEEAQYLIGDEAVAAYKMKDKLLVFDKENAKRTHVFDAQADWYESANWLGEDEKKRIDDKERRRREARKNRGRKNKINITFDLAGRKTIEYVEDEEEEENAAAEEEFEPDPEEDDEEGRAYENAGLQEQRGKAGEVYRLMKQRWEQQSQAQTSVQKKG